MDILTGVDIVEVLRIKNAIDKPSDSFLRRVFTKNEIDYCNSKGTRSYESYAARYAAKEAVSKAFATGIGNQLSFLDIEVLVHDTGKPFLLFHGKGLDLYQKLKVFSSDISLSHTKQEAIAVCVFLRE